MLLANTVDIQIRKKNIGINKKSSHYETIRNINMDYIALGRKIATTERSQTMFGTEIAASTVYTGRSFSKHRALVCSDIARKHETRARL